MTEHQPTALSFVEQPTVPETFNVLLYGPAGSGKSTAAATAPGPILWVNAEGPGAISFPRKIAATRGTTIHEVRIEAQTAINSVLWDVKHHVQFANDPQAQTVVIDTLGKVRDALIRQLVSPGAKNTIQQFGEVAKVLSDFIRHLRDLPVNLVVICHEDIADADGERIVQPLIGGALTPKVPAEMDVVAFCGVSKDSESGGLSYLGQLVEDRGRRCKDRSGGLGRARALDLSEWLQTYRDALAPEAPSDEFAEAFTPLETT